MKRLYILICALFVLSMTGCCAPSVDEATELIDLENGQYMVNFTDRREDILLPDVIEYYASQGYKVVAFSGAESSRGYSIVIFSR